MSNKVLGRFWVEFTRLGHTVLKQHLIVSELPNYVIYIFIQIRKEEEDQEDLRKQSKYFRSQTPRNLTCMYQGRKLYQGNCVQGPAQEQQLRHHQRAVAEEGQ